MTNRELDNLGRYKNIAIDLERGEVTVVGLEGRATYPIDSALAFAAVSDVWLRTGWDNKYVYSFTWMGRPIIQLPEDMIRIQETIYTVKPDVIVETGVAHGGSLVFYASLCKAMGKGRVIGVDVEIRPHNRMALESHELYPLITLIEGDSLDPEVVKAVRAEVNPRDAVFVMLDSSHTKEHVLAELRAYAPLVTQGSYIVVADGIMERLVGAPRTRADWSWNNPQRAAMDFVQSNDGFIIEDPPFRFNEGTVTSRVTYFPSGYIKRVQQSQDA